MDLDAETIFGFSETFLQPQYDAPVKSPDFHFEIWDLCASDNQYVALAAPREHAKSTCVTHAFILACIVYRIKSFVLIISDTEGQASEFLGDIKAELEENEVLREVFGIDKLVKDNSTDIIVRFTDGRLARIRAFGAEQKVRGRKWRNKRPDLIVVDDLENDEMVENQDRREKLRAWFLKALVPCLSKHGHIRVIGTILHLDSLLYRILHSSAWMAKLYKAHDGFDVFTGILWEAQWPENRLRLKRQMYIDEGYPEGYSQEYLNDPVDQGSPFFRRPDLLEMEPEHHYLFKNFYAAVDFAISDKDRADFTVIIVGGMDEFGQLHIVDLVRFRGDTTEIIDWMFAMQTGWNIDSWLLETGQIKLAIDSELQHRMISENVVLNYETAVPQKDKRARARPAQGRIRAKGLRFDKEQEWWPVLEEELLHFPKGAKKDQVDALSWLCSHITKMSPGPTDAEMQEEELELARTDWETNYAADDTYDGRDETTGY